MPAVADAPADPASAGAEALPDWAGGTDAHGAPHAHLLPDAAAWFRRAAASPDAAEPAFRGTITKLAALCDRRGLPAFAPDRRAHRLPADLLAAAKAAGVKRDDPSRTLLRTVQTKATPTPPDWDDAAAPGFQSDAAAVGLLRSDWGRKSDALALAWPPGSERGRPAPVGLELRAFGRRLLCGAWGLSLMVDGEPVDVGGDGWACVCHHADFDGGYLELQWAGDSAAGPVRVERQAFLSRRGHFAVLSDAVSFPRDLGRGSRGCDAAVEHAQALPLAGTGRKRVTAGVAGDTREARLYGGRPDRPRQRARAFPLNLPQETHDPADGAVTADDAGVAQDEDAARPGSLSAGWLTVRSAGRGGLCSPVVLDWHPDREDRRADWRALTVTENRRRLRENEAAAHRLRVGRKHHLLLYRRTDGTDRPGEPRAVLGHHHDRETLIANVSKTGDIEPLLAV